MLEESLEESWPVWWLQFWILPCRPWVDSDEMLVEPMKILGNRWKEGMEFRVFEEKKKGTRLLFSSRNAVMPRIVGL